VEVSELTLPNPSFFNMDKESVLKQLETQVSGLSEREASDRLHRLGPNTIESEKRISLLRRIVNQLKNVMVLILTVAAAIALLVGDIKSTLIVVAVIIMNTVLGVAQESKAEKAIEALRNLASPDAIVRRDGLERVVKAKELVIGDVVLIEPGNHIPADIRLIEAINLKIEEASLTGESVPTEKQTNLIKDTEVSLGDKINMAFTGTSVVYGRGTGVVIATAMETEIGKIAKYLSQNNKIEETPLQKRLAEMSKYISVIIVLVSLVIFFTGLIWGRSMFDMFLTAVSLAVAAIPEGLPAIVTIILALGVQKMAKKNAIVRKLPAVETLGSTQVICTDKTGTLTKNEMTVVQLNFLNDTHLADSMKTNSIPERLLQAMVLCNDSRFNTNNGKESYSGDPTETALLKFSIGHGAEKPTFESIMPRIAEVPFDSGRKMMSTIHNCQGSVLTLTKGALDILLEKCDYVVGDNGVLPLLDDDRDRIESTSRLMAANALRVLAFAYKELKELPEPVSSETIENGLVFIGFVGMIDPARPEVRDAVKVCREAGIRPVMITGDHIVTAIAIARDLGILNSGDIALEGKELEKMSDAELLLNIEKFSVFARVSPEHKVRIVQAWKRSGKVTAMTGDGVNDAPALKAADISIGMGMTGTDVAKGVSDIILVDDNFATIVSAVKEGRKIFNNIKKVIHFLLSTHFGEVITLFIATLFNWVILFPVHLLWVNLIIDTLPALALGMEKADKRLMLEKPASPDQKLFANGLGFNIILHGLMKGILVLAAYLVAQNNHSQEVAVTTAFATLGLVQLAHALSLRSKDFWTFSTNLPFNKYLLVAVLGAAVMQVIVIVVPVFNKVFNVTQLKWEEWLITIIASLMIIPLVDLQKWIAAKFSIRKNL
jgi:P-type Ca2+ transporter type 2C